MFPPRCQLVAVHTGAADRVDLGAHDLHHPDVAHAEAEPFMTDHDNRALLDDLLIRGTLNLERSAIFERVPPTPPPGCWDRVEGMLFGLAIGDALGRTSEGLLPLVRRARHGEIRDYLPHPAMLGERVGLPSDDTQLAFWTLEQLLEDDGLVPEKVATRFFDSGHIYGIGQTVLRWRLNMQREVPWQQAGIASAGNGALMRIAPILLPHLREPSPALWADAALLAVVTHNDPASTASCVAFVDLLWELIGRDDAPEPQWWVERFCSAMEPLEGATRYRPRLARLAYEGPVGRFTRERVLRVLDEEETVEQACDRWHSGAYLLETVPSVIHVLARHGHDPEEAIVRAVNDTKDNDTTAAIVGAAIVGAAVGALHGRRALPERWIRGLLGRTRDNDDGRVFALLEQARERWAP
jgi:ADP-ribosyl-[dinitrogen reductase] hydrolase